MAEDLRSLVGPFGLGVKSRREELQVLLQGREDKVRAYGKTALAGMEAGEEQGTCSATWGGSIRQARKEEGAKFSDCLVTDFSVLVQGTKRGAGKMRSCHPA